MADDAVSMTVSVAKYAPPLPHLSFPPHRKMVPQHPPGDGCQVTIPTHTPGDSCQVMPPPHPPREPYSHNAA